MHKNRYSNEKSFENKGWRYLAKIDKIEKDLKNIKYRLKFCQLTQTHVFYFDIYQIITDKNQNAVNKLCNCFYRFLALRMLCQYYENYKSGSSTQSKSILYKKALSKSKLAKATSIQSNSYGDQLRQIKNRANTTVTIATKNDFIPQKKSRLKKSKNQTQANFKNKTQAIQEQKQQNDFPMTQQEELFNAIVETCQQLKQAYFLLNQSCGNKSRVAKIQIICFLIALISPDILYPIVQEIEKQFKPSDFTKGKQQNKQFIKVQQGEKFQQKFDIEEEVYIVLTYQTLGNLVSPNVFTFLKKKYVRQTIFQCLPEQNYVRLVRSLKHIKQKLTSQKDIILIKGRRQRDIQRQKIMRINSIQQQYQPFSKQKMKNFIKQSLKTKDTIDINKPIKPTLKQDELQVLSTKLRESFYPSFSLNKIPAKMSLPKESPTTKHSVSLKIKLNLENTKQNKNKQIKRRKYVSNIHKTFYKLKPHNENKKNASTKVIRSERPSHKFNQISLQNNFDFGARTMGFDKDCIQHMKMKINKFKCQALKDLETIQQFKPNKLMLRQKSKQNQQHYLQQQKNSKLIRHHFRKVSSVLGNLNIQNRNLTDLNRQNNIKYKIGPLTNHNDKQQVTWHEMYNIRTEPICTTKSVEGPKIVYKLSKNSDKLRKFQKQFTKECVKRVQALQEDLDSVQKLRLI